MMKSAHEGTQSSTPARAGASEFLKRAIDLLSSGSCSEQGLASLARSAVPSFSDFCMIHVLRDGNETAVAAEPWEPDPQTDYSPFSAVECGNVIILNHNSKLSRQLGAHQLLIAPIRSGDRTFGAISFVSAKANRFDGEAIQVARTIGNVAGLFLDNAQLRVNTEDQTKWETERARLAAIVDTSEDAIVSKDLDGIVTSWNAAAERIYGWKADEIIGQSKGLVIPKDLPDELPGILRRIRRGQRIAHYETQRIRKDGARIEVAISVSPVKNACGKIVGAATIVRDITAQVRARHEIEALNARLQQAMRETHHRVKNNLQVVAAMVDMQILERSGGSVPVEELTRLGGHIRMLAAVHDALTHYLNEDEKEQCLSARMIFERLIPLLQITAGQETIQVELDDLYLTGKQATALALIVNELVSNAVKHGIGPIQMKLEREDSVAVLRVRDQGPGFPAGFDPSACANTGLELVETLAATDLRGDVDFHNHPQGGAEISLTMTLAEDMPQYDCSESDAGRRAA